MEKELIQPLNTHISVLGRCLLGDGHISRKNEEEGSWLARILLAQVLSWLKLLYCNHVPNHLLILQHENEGDHWNRHAPEHTHKHA